MSKTELDGIIEAGGVVVGRSVVYEDSQGKSSFGRITSWNERFVFVCFDITGRGVACRYEDVRFE